MPTPPPPSDPLAPTVYIETYGCAFNRADSESMAGVLEADRFRLVESAEGADLIILNTCTVKDRTWAHFRHRLGQLRRRGAAEGGAALLVAGCIPAAHQAEDVLAGVAVLGPGQVGHVAAAARAVLAGQVPRWVARGGAAAAAERPNLPVRRERAHIEILPIASGCRSACTFCQTRLARGRLRSFHPEDLLRRAREAAAAGVVEIWLTAQDTGAFGHDIGYPLPRLLRELCALEGAFRIRLGMTSPQWVLERLEEYLEVFAHPKMLTTWHVPLQSGSDAVLQAMRRGNTGEDFVRLAEAFHARFPRGALLTDIIVGYPTETEADFAATLEVLRRARVAGVNRSKFSPRPGTPAAALPPLPPAVVRERMERLTACCAEVGEAWHRPFVGQADRVQMVETKRTGSTIAHNAEGRPVIIQGNWPMGMWLTVSYIGYTKNHLKGAKQRN